MESTGNIEMFDDTTDTGLLVTGIGRKVKQKALIVSAAILPNIRLDVWF